MTTTTTTSDSKHPSRGSRFLNERAVITESFGTVNIITEPIATPPAFFDTATNITADAEADDSFP